MDTVDYGERELSFRQIFTETLIVCVLYIITEMSTALIGSQEQAVEKLCEKKHHNY